MRFNQRTKNAGRCPASFVLVSAVERSASPAPAAHHQPEQSEDPEGIGRIRSVAVAALHVGAKRRIDARAYIPLSGGVRAGPTVIANALVVAAAIGPADAAGSGLLVAGVAAGTVVFTRTGANAVQTKITIAVAAVVTQSAHTGLAVGALLAGAVHATFAVGTVEVAAVLVASIAGGAITVAVAGVAVTVAGVPHVVISAIPDSLIAMALMGPVVFVAGWPWLWTDTGKRFVEYVGFHLGHYPIYLFYEGEIYTKPFAPWHAPFTMAAGTIPLSLFVLGFIGTAVATAALVRVIKGARKDGDYRAHSERDRLFALVLLQAGAAIGIVAFLGSPKYGGEKFFMPFFPLFMVLAAAGLAEVLCNLATLLLKLSLKGSGFTIHGASALPGGERFGPLLSGALIAAGLALLAFAPGVMGTARFHGGFALSYYAEALGGLPGATARGYERTYYDIADKELARWLDDNADGAKVHFEPNHKEYARIYRWLKRDGVISKKLRLERRRDRADILVLIYERRWVSYPALLREHRGHEKLYEKRIEGVPLYTVYRRKK